MSAPEGYRFEWVEAGPEWRAGGDDRRCRFMSGHPLTRCSEPAVAALDRGTRTPRWWHYCGAHLYGRRLSPDGRQVLSRRVVQDAASVSREGSGTA